MHRRTSAMLTALVLLLTLTAGAALAASMEIWPSERRANNTFFCYGDDWNWMLFTIYPGDFGKHRLELPEEFVEPTTLTVTLPQSVDFLGADIMRGSGVASDFEVTQVTRNGNEYQQIAMPLPDDILTQRLIRGGYYFHVLMWFEAPEALDDIVAYTLQYGGQELVAGESRLLTAGVIEERPLPERFGFYPYGIHTTVPGMDHDHMAEFWSRFGVSGMEGHWTYGLPAEEGGPTKHHLTFEANRRHGVKNIANMTLFAREHGGAFGGRREAVMELGGLVPAMDASCEGLESEAALEDWRIAHEYFDMALWDWEPGGPHVWPGYDDPATIAAFAEAEGLPADISADTVREEHREDYARFRMEQVARPLYAMQRTINAVGPVPLRIEQGSGASSHIDYDVYGDDFPALTPMIYQPSPIGYARNLLETLENTDVPSEKFWPDMTIGWSVASVHRNTPEEFLMDTMVTAAAGCGSVSHWPNMHYCDAAWFGIHEGLARIAMVEQFYLDGAHADGITLEGVPYREETIKLGNRTLDHSAPDWKASLITFSHEFGGEQLLTLMNYHPSEACFVRVDGADGRYLVNPVEDLYQTIGADGGALVEVPAGSPGLWIATDDQARIATCGEIDGATVQDRFVAARDAFLESNTASEVSLGTVGEITTAYGMVQFGGEERVVLQVRTPEQTLSFGASGGRVFGWDVEGMEAVVSSQGFGTDGLVMDMLWLPATARWSGDEVAEMSLVTCSNDGQEARVVYEGALTNGAPGIRLRKTYRVRASGTTLGVEVTFRNDRVDQEPAVLSYWSHNVLAVEPPDFVGEEVTHEAEKGATTIFPAEGLPEDLAPEVLMRDKIVAETGPAYAEYFPAQNAGLVVRLPENFMTVYRWCHYDKRMCGSEWMSQPLSIPAGRSESLNFSLTAVPEATPEALRETLSAATGEEADANLLPFGFSNIGDDGLPADWTVEAAGENADSVGVTAGEDDTGATVVTMAMPQEATAQLDTAARFSVDPAGDYMLAVDVKVEDMRYTGDWYRKPAGVRIYVYGTENKHTWLAIYGEGSTDGWVTALLPSPTEGNRQQFASARVLLRAYNMAGTVSFRNPMILRQPEGMRVPRSFELSDGTQVPEARLQLRR